MELSLATDLQLTHLLKLMTEIKYNPTWQRKFVRLYQEFKKFEIRKKINHPEAIYFETEKN
jgi:hypothetical protein